MEVEKAIQARREFGNGSERLRRRGNQSQVESIKREEENRRSTLQRIAEQGEPTRMLFCSDTRRKKKKGGITREDTVVEETQQVL